MKSMTGYGKGFAEANGRSITIEIKAVNHRFSDILFKLPRTLAFVEDRLKKEIQAKISRGHLDVFCTYKNVGDTLHSLRLDKSLAEQYKGIAEELSAMGIQDDLTASTVVRLADVVVDAGEQEDEEALASLALSATKTAVKNLTKMREKEGKALKTDLLSKLAAIETLTETIAARAPLVGEEHAEKLRQRIEEALRGVELDEARLLNEVAFFIDKASIDEEITRMRGHIEHGRAVFEEKEPIGKKLDFLVQEMNREANTMGSKSNDLQITRNVLLLKSEIEKVREQVQNIE